MPQSRLLVMLAAILFLCTGTARAQTQASCTFVNFGLAVNIPSLGPGFITPAGINDYGTIVGTATPSNDQIGYQVAFIRWANGGYSFPFGTGSASNLAGRNDNGISIGNPSTLLNGTTVSDITLNGAAGPINSVNGIDNGTVVGGYSGGGFIYSKGKWATLNFPSSTFTTLVGITNSGVIIGNALMPDKTSTPFLYENGTFKVISVPGAAVNSTTLFGISPKLGLILGNGFVAKCQ
jgi:hypothetical protein